MITIQDLIRLLKIENALIHNQTSGLSEQDALIQPQPGGNCLNWVVGHLLDTQILMLTTLGGVSPIKQSELTRYERESEPIHGEEPGTYPMKFLLERLDAVHLALIEHLKSMSENDFEKEIDRDGKTQTLGWRIFFLYFHYTYHVGQLEQLRQLAGYTEKII